MRLRLPTTFSQFVKRGIPTFFPVILTKSLCLRYYFFTQPGISLRTVRMTNQGKRADGLIIPIGSIDRRGVPLAGFTNSSHTRNWHTIQIDANEAVCRAASDTPLSGAAVGSWRLCLFHEPGPILKFKNKKRVTQPPKSGSRSPCLVSTSRASLNPSKAGTSS
jgi:hypothetical protein